MGGMVNDFLRPRPRKHHVSPSNQWQQPVVTPNTPSVDAPQQSSGHAPHLGSVGMGGFVGGTTPQPPKRSIKDRLRSVSKKQWIIIGAASFVILGGGVSAFLLLNGDEKQTPQVSVKENIVKEPPKPTTVASTLTGLQVDPAINERQVTGVMIENSLDARPQSGLREAGVVFEAIAEGGITRFLTLFQDVEPEYVGPVRSVRPYYVQWLNGFDAAVAHVGGSAEALAMLRSGQGKDLDQFSNPGPYWRVSNRYAPHNMYTSIPKLNELEASKGWTKSSYKAIPRAEKDSPSAAPDVKQIDFNVSGAIYNPHYDYDPGSNSYKRSEGGKPHTDEKSGEQLMPKVVVGLVMPQGRNGIYTTYQTIGSGEAYVFQNGTLNKGTWHKSANNSNFTFTDAAGKELKLNPGQTWFTVVGGADRVTYKP
jgi:hypothetical protein